jgi:hypothetical protein
MVAGMPECPSTGDAEGAKRTRDRYSVVGLEPALDFALPLAVAGGPRIVGTYPARDVDGAGRAPAGPFRTTPRPRAAARFLPPRLLGAWCRSTVPGGRSSARLAVARPTAGIRPSGIPGRGLLARLLAGWCALWIARTFGRTRPSPDGVVESSNLPVAGRHAKTVPNMAPPYVPFGRVFQPVFRLRRPNTPRMIAAGCRKKVRGYCMWRPRPLQYGARSSRLSTLPVGFRGRTSVKATDVGHL